MSSVLAGAIRAGAHPALPRVGHKVAPFLSILLREPPPPPPKNPLPYPLPLRTKPSKQNNALYDVWVQIRCTLSQSIHFTLCSLLMLRLPFSHFRVLYSCRKLFCSYEPMLRFITEIITLFEFPIKAQKSGCKMD